MNIDKAINTDKKKLIEIYELYGFCVEDQTNDYIVFSHTNGYFNNIEIVFFNEKKGYEDLKRQYEDIGYAVKTEKYSEIKIHHKRLFEGFFDLKNSAKGIKNIYNSYCQKQKEHLLTSNYSYLHCDYICNNQEGEKDIVDLIHTKLTERNAQLVILEAAAGYGKTCSSYEVFNSFARDENFVPMLMELSRNRKASLFKYVLLDEIDRQFKALKVNTVKYEIKQGRVPLIIDGFDELLSKTDEKALDDDFEEAKSMLNTIADLLSGDSKAKILLTSRKSAMFVGEKYEEWLLKYDLIDKTTRIELKTPQIKNWLEWEKEKAIRDKGIDLNSIANPIILALLREKSVDEIRDKSVNDIILEYVTRIMNRERERQSLLLTVSEQMDVLQELAKEFVEYGITSEDSTFVKDVIGEILQNRMSEFLKRYSDSPIEIDNATTADEFLMKIVHHAFLDRKQTGRNVIGFINDFVFGFFLGRAMLYNGLKRKNEKIDYKYIDLICTACETAESDIKEAICGEIKPLLSDYSCGQQLEISNKLYHKTVLPFDSVCFDGITCNRGFVFTSAYKVTNCVFSNCVFDGCTFENGSLENVNFYNCLFFNPKLDSAANLNANLMFLVFEGYEEIYHHFKSTDCSQIDEINYEKIILEQFWKKGSSAPETRRAFTAIRRGVPAKEWNNIDWALKNLIKREVLKKLSVCYELNYEKMQEICAILGRT